MQAVPTDRPALPGSLPQAPAAGVVPPHARPILVVGRKPPPVTGENLCRQFLAHSLRELGYLVEEPSRSSLPALLRSRTTIWLLPGSTRIGHIRDVAFLLLWLALGCRVEVYIHNACWRRFCAFAVFWRFVGRNRLRFIVLTDEIAGCLARCGLQVLRLNNTLVEGNEPAPVPPVPRKKLVWMGAVTEEKGFPTAHSVFSRLHALDPQWEFHVYGTGPLYCERTSFPLAQWHGFVSGEDKQQAWNRGGIFILPSRYVNETQPLAIIEALAHGLPFIASKVGGIPAMTGGPAHPAGICLDCHAPSEAWVAAVQHLISKYSRYSEGAYTTYRRHFSRKAYWDGLRSLMKNPPSID